MGAEGWIIDAWLARTRASQIGRARPAAGGAPALLKACTGDVTAFRAEFTLLQSLATPGLVHPLALTRVGASPAMVLDDHDVVSMADALSTRSFDVGAVLRFACTVTRALGTLHGAGLVHGDLRPANLLVEPAGDAVWIADLSAAMERKRAADGVSTAVDDWAWVAPEQTGRMNRPVDHRVDFYNVGLLLYRMLAGRAPFDAADALEWAHCHTARLPAAPATVAAVPPGVSDLVLKLLAKTAEQRYRQADGLLKDLEHCLAEWETNRTVPAFALGAQDAAGEFEAPQVLIGRERERAALLDAWTRTAATAQPQLVLVTGPAGIGKTSLVQTLQEPVLAARGRFVSAKFDSQRRDLPYATIAQALHELVRQLLAEPEAEIVAVRSALTGVLGASGQLMIDAVPALELVIGPQPPLPVVAPAEAQNRLRWVLGRFVGVFAQAARPLVIFLDDLQWADAASVALLRELLLGGGRALLVVGAYRDQEVDPAHPLASTVDSMRADGASVTQIALAPLAPDDVAALTAESLHTTAAQAAPLAALVHERTGGNPFFAFQFLAELRTAALVRYDAQARRWTWDLEEIRARSLADNVVHLIVRRLRRLPRPVRDILRQAACLGTSGSATLLAAATGRAPPEVADALAQAAHEGLVVRRNGDYRFAHDRVQEAAYALIPRARRAATHRQIGQRLLAALPPSQREEHLFAVVSQLNRGAAAITDAAEAAMLARLNAAAGRKAKATLDFAAALEHLARARAAWPADAWATGYEETFELEFDLAECEFLVARFQDADARLEALLDRARSRDERARIYGLRIRLRLLPGHFGAAATAALDALHLFGIVFPTGDARELIAQERREIEHELAGRRVDELLDASPLQDPDVRTVLGLMVDSFTGIYIAQPAIFPLLVLKATRLVLRHGNCEESAVVYTYYARVLLAAFGEIRAAYDYSQLAVRLNERLADRRRRGMLLFSHAGFIHFWCRPFASGRPILDRGFAACLDVGNFVHAALIAVNTCLYMVEGGEHLDELAAQTERGIAFLRATRSGGTLEVVQAFAQFARCLRGGTRAPGSFDDDGYDHAGAVQRMTAQKNLAGLGIVHMLEQVAAFVAGDMPGALQAAARTQAVLNAVYAMAVRPTFVLYRALALAAAYDDLPAAEQPASLHTIAQAADDLAVWAETCPENYATRHALVAAELARLQGHELDAERLYERSIEAARASGLGHQEAVACERTAAFYRKRGFARIADAYQADAHAAYARWGAAGKLLQMEAQHPALRATPRAGVPIDTLAVIKATQAVSSQIDIDALLDTLMRIALEQAGAQAGRLYVSDGEGLELAAEAEVRGETLDVQVHRPPTPAHDDDAHPSAVLNYVRRSRERVLLDDATRPHRYAADAYLRRRRPRSVLCMPLARQSRTIGVLYLEHLLGTHAFTPEREAVLGMLASQAAISLEIARLYAALREENTQRQRAEAASREWQARVGRLVDSNIMAVRIAMLDGRIVDANDAYLRIVGYTRADMEAGLLTTQRITAPEFQTADERATEELRQHGRYLPYEKEYVRKDGTRVPVLAGGILFQGEPPQTVGFVLDLTERRRAEEERRARLEAVAASQAKSAFLANMSHELRTPMNAIIGMSELALRTNLDARQADYIKKVNTAARSLLIVINDLLDFSKIEAGQLAIEQIPFELGAVMENLAALVRLKADEKRLELVFALPADLPTHLVGDPHRLSQVLVNLCNNALKFTERGEVVVSVRVFERDTDCVTLQFEVRDTGVGIDFATQRRLFVPFSQADSSTSRRFGGTGLGLAICRHLVGLMGGEIGLESAPGRGSTFFFRLPFGVSTPERAAPAGTLRGTRVLVVDDNAASLDALCDMARGLGLVPDRAVSGEAALQSVLQADAQDRPYGLLLLDFQMPGMDGVECARRVLQGSLRHAAPVVMLVTALDHDVLAKRLTDARLSVAATLLKPVTPSALMDACAASLERAPKPPTREQRRDLAQRADARRLAGARVLVVEDNLINQEVARGLLEPAGIVVQVAGDGQEALDLLAREPFDAVLMDCQMPVVDGYEATRRIRADGRWPGLPIIAMTADAMVGDRERALAAGMNDHVAKPISVEELFTVLARAIGRRQTHDPADASRAGARTAALERMGNNRALFERTVSMYQTYRSTFVDRFRAARAAGDLDTAGRLSHDLKGIAGLVGELTVAEAAGALERACRDEPGAVDAALASVEQALAAPPAPAQD